MSHRALLAAAGAQAKLYSEDVFSAYTYTGNGSTQTITNGIDLTKGGLIWSKSRSSSNGHGLSDTVRGISSTLSTNSAIGEQANASDVLSVSSTGFGLGFVGGFSNSAGNTYASWTFRRAPKFFDVVTWTGDGTSNRQILHALGIAPGMVTAKRRDSTGDWAVWHRSATGDLYLDTTAVQTGSFTQITAASATTFSVSGNANILNATYVAYAWAHDPDTVNGIVQCGTFTADGSGNATVSLGWEPQYVMVRNPSGAANWLILDSARGGLLAAPSTSDAFLSANTSSAETTLGQTFAPTAAGFSAVMTASQTYIYLAIRRGPMRTPTSGASVYNAIARTGTGAAATVTGVGFAPDLVIDQVRSSSGATTPCIWDRLRGPLRYVTALGPIAENSSSTDTLMSFDPGGLTLGADAGGLINNAGRTFINWLFARAPGFFDVVCYKGTGANQTLAHNLGIAPGMMWIVDRTTANDWNVYHSALGAGKSLVLDSNAISATDTTFLNNTAPTATSFTVGAKVNTNQSGDNLIAYLFGALAGISSIGSYTGNGATQTINCGFASGARFVLIKRTDSVGDWVVLDTARGIISGNDPYLLLNKNVAEVTTADLLTPQSVGFGLTSNALVNANGGTFIYFAVA